MEFNLNLFTFSLFSIYIQKVGNQSRFGPNRYKQTMKNVKTKNIYYVSTITYRTIINVII